MNRERAMMIVLAEAFSERGLASLVENGADPGPERIDNLVEALAFLVDELADEDSFSREFVSALFVLGNRVPDLMRSHQPEAANFRPSLHKQAGDLTVAVTALIENWNHWPDWETHALSTYPFETPSEKSAQIPQAENVGGYGLGDVTYCMLPDTPDCFPVRVDRLGNGYLDSLHCILGERPKLPRLHQFPYLLHIPKSWQGNRQRGASPYPPQRPLRIRSPIAG